MITQEPALRQVRVEQAGSSDLADVMKVMTSAFDPRFGEAWTRPQCAGILPMAGVSLRVARAEDGAPLGFALFRTVASEAELLLLAVVPANRRRGVGRTLLEDFMASARGEGATMVHLEVRENNTAIQMYTAAGFTAVGRRRDYYSGSDGVRFDALTLSRSL